MYEYKAKIERVVDADTIDVSVDLGFDVWTRQRVRVAGLNAAEKNTEAGKKAIEYAKSVLKHNMEVTLRSHQDKREKFGRYLAEIIIDEATYDSYNENLLRLGYAVPYDGKSPKELHVPILKDEDTAGVTYNQAFPHG
jgi:micrococcal nuclease